MDWESELVKVYLNVCEMWEQGVWVSAQRFSNNSVQALTDQELMTMYIFGSMYGFSDMKKIYEFIDNFLRPFFPDLKGYDAFCYRLRALAQAFILMGEKLMEATDKRFAFDARRLTDSMPIEVANGKRSNTATVASGLADKGYCALKQKWYYGMPRRLSKEHQLAKISI